ncbi:MAG: sensor histidine kinase [Actinomycetota bacterium]
MKTLAWAVIVVLAAGLSVAELAMNLTAPDRGRLYLVFGLMAAATFATALFALRVTGSLRSLRTSLRLVAFGAVAITGGVVAVSALSMFIEKHDLYLVLVALLLGVGLGGVLAGAVARPLTSDLARLSDTAGRVAAGDLSVRTGIGRGDELGTAARAFDQMVSQLAASEDERRQLLVAIGHDLRTPLSSMQAAVEALQDGIADDPASYLRGMAKDLEYLRHLVDSLFLLSRIEAGRLEVSPIAIDLAELADEAVEAVAPAAAERRVHLVVEAPGHVGVMGDPTALGRVFRNLLMNAVRHSPEAGEVRVELARCDGRVETVVIDQGPGFEEGLRSRAFDRFVRADAARSRDSGGAGLGLAIAKGIVEAHGGSIAIDDGPGGRVRFALPCA